MTAINHRRKNKLPVNQRQDSSEYHNGYAYVENKLWPKLMEEKRKELDDEGKQDVTLLGYGASGAPRVGRTDYLDKSMHGWARKSDFANKTVSANIGNDFSNGHRGMAKAVRGAKKFVRSRIRAAENQQLQKEFSKLNTQHNEMEP